MRLYGLLGGGGGGGGQVHIRVQSMGHAIWWNLGLFLHKHNSPFIVSLKLL